MCTIFLIFLIFHFLSGKFSKKNTHYNLFVAIFTVGIFWFLFNTGMRHNLTTDSSFKSSFNRLQSAYQGKIVYLPPLAFQWEKMDPLKRYHFNFHMITAGGTNTFSPSFYNSLEKLGVKKGYEMMPAMVNNSSVFVVADSAFMKWLSNYLKKSHNINCKTVMVDRLANGRTVFKLRKKYIAILNDL
ncbi:hypothetical protein BGP_5680 [Beggiatoa sp. PS]|nr:hypothetical protein BGP_5680 [Beggiatoa sp. PS]